MSPEAIEELEKEIRASEKKVVMFSLEWCEFCWAAIKVFDEYEIPYRVINVDSAEYVENLRGRNIRLALNERTGWNTMPQMYVNGEFIGGCMDLFEDCKSGELQTRLDVANIGFNKTVNTDPASFLPSWLHPR